FGGSLQWICFPDRDDVPLMAEAVPDEGDSDHLRGSDRRAEQDEQGDRPRGGLGGAAAAVDGDQRTDMSLGLPIYKMSGSGNDFVFVDGRNWSIQDWTPEQIAHLCARGTGVGADGLVFVAPGSGPGAVRMIYYNSDGSHAAMCGNAALCSTRLAAHLGISGRAMRLETDAGVYESRVNGVQDRA